MDARIHTRARASTGGGAPCWWLAVETTSSGHHPPSRQCTRARKIAPSLAARGGLRARTLGREKSRPRRLRAEGYRAESCARRAARGGLRSGAHSLRDPPPSRWPYVGSVMAARAAAACRPRLFWRAIAAMPLPSSCHRSRLRRPTLSGAPSLRAEGCARECWQ